MKNVFKYGGILLVGVVIGVGVTQSPATEQVASAQPETITSIKEVIKEVPGPERVVTKEVKVEVTPQVCIEALNYASEGFSYAGDFADAATEAFEAASELDARGIDAAGVKMNGTTKDLQRLQPKLTSASQSCRAKA